MPERLIIPTEHPALALKQLAPDDAEGGVAGVGDPSVIITPEKRLVTKWRDT